MPSSCQLCGSSFTSHFHLLALLSCPTLMPLIATRAVLSEMETCLWHPLLNPPQWLPSVLKISPGGFNVSLCKPFPVWPH